MADIIPFPTGRTSNPASKPGRELPLHQSTDPFIGGLAQDTMNRLDKMMEEIAELYEDSYAAERGCCRFDMRDVEKDAETSQADLLLVTELIVFSPEIQLRESEAKEADNSGPRLIHWGDVFFKSGDVYPFLFTVYTQGYVKHQFLNHGEKITPSPKDIILRRKHLSPPDIVRAVLKWVNLYAPLQQGKPVRLESDGVLQNLICEPGIEVVVAEPS